jgi:DNA-binding transcriptional ArsR family regulator
MIDEVLHALVEPRRRKLLELVNDHELTSGELASHFPDVTRPAISQHLKVLEDAGLVLVRREGTRRLYRAKPDNLEELREYLEIFWENRLQRLKEAVETETRSKKDE